MKKINIPRVIWVVCLFLVLIVILIMVMDYKINYQYLTQSKLYFYECEGSDVCISENINEDDLVFSSYDCGYDNCPLFTENIGSGYVLLSLDDKMLLYNYENGEVISDIYDDYEIINDEFVIVLKDNYYGVINTNGEIIVGLIYEEVGYRGDDGLTGYGDTEVIAKKDGKYGIVSLVDGGVVEEFNYDEDNIEVLLEMVQT